jgi:hypothetical protein
MTHNESHNGARGAIVTLADVEKELHRLRESKMALVSTAGKLGLAVPRSCCPHRGGNACLWCSSDWLVAQVRLARDAVN